MVVATMPPVVKSVELRNHVTLPYAEQGDPSGPPVLLLHGFADSWRSFELVLPHLPESIHAFALTQRGHGDASRPATGYGIPDFAADIAAFQDAIHLPAAVIVGHSMGSGVALRFAVDHPERTMGLILVGASPSMGGTAAARQFWDSTVSKLTDPVDPALVRGMTEGLLARPVPPAFLDAAIGDGLKVPALVWKAAFESRWSLEGDYSAELSRIRAPTLIVWGDQDARYPRGEQEALASAIKGSRLIVYPGAGHLLHWEEPQRFASDLVKFVEGLSSARDTGDLNDCGSPSRPPTSRPRSAPSSW
jgi:pimeloyl-ACP methyl ester carboxylesterase